MKKGSYLLLENLDRLSREHVGVAVERFLSLVNGRAVVVQLLPNPTEFRRPVDMMQVMPATLELSRGHSESAMKSARQKFGRPGGLSACWRRQHRVASNPVWPSLSACAAGAV